MLKKIAKVLNLTLEESQKSIIRQELANYALAACMDSQVENEALAVCQEQTLRIAEEGEIKWRVAFNL